MVAPKPRRHPEAAFRAMGDEGGLVVLPTRREVKVLNEVGMRVFAMLDGTHTEDEIIATKQIMEWPTEPFFVPDELAAAAEAIRERGASSHAEWQARLAAYRAKFPEAASALDGALAGDLPEGWDADLPIFEADPKGTATRKASGAVLNALAAKIGGLVGGSADLAGSNNSHLKGLSSFLPGADEIGRAHV